MEFIPQKMVGLKGETLSVLFSDLNQDGKVDLFVANDREIPDMYYEGIENTFLKLLKKSSKISSTPMNTMSIETADFNNDLLLDLFSVDMNFRNEKQKPYCDSIDNLRLKSSCLVSQLVSLPAEIQFGPADDHFVPMQQYLPPYSIVH